MTDGPSAVVKTISLSSERAEQLQRLSETTAISEDEIVAKALDILFSLTDLLDAQAERHGWSSLSEASLARVWGNREDARYDNWRELYGIPSG